MFTAEKCDHSTSIQLDSVGGIDIHRCTWVCGKIYYTVTEGITTHEIPTADALLQLQEIDTARAKAHQAGDGLA